MNKQYQVFEQTIQIDANSSTVEKCITDRVLMHRWLNPLLKCEPIGQWSTEVGSKSRFVIQIPLLKPTLISVVKERGPGLVIWEFNGFFRGYDRWECQPNEGGTYLINRFTFLIPNPLVSWGFNKLAASLTKQDMKAQLKRLKKLAEKLGKSINN
jgi:hypothetical protein